jgi:hypothetical protein
MTALQPLWWLALPLLALPIWWHMRRRERTKTELLATARFLPAAAPRQRRVPQWIDRLLLLGRLLLLLNLIAWLAVTVFPWRGDTVLADEALPRDVVARESAAAGMSSAAVTVLPADALAWIESHRHEFRRNARVLVLAQALPMPARQPQPGLELTVRIVPAARSKAWQPAVRHIVLASAAEREARWRALIAAFAASGERYEITQAPTPQTELVIWDLPGSPPEGWRAPLWWRTSAPPAGAIAVQSSGIRLAVADTPQGRTWTSPDWPALDPEKARAIYETWRRLALDPVPYQMPSTEFAAVNGAAPSGSRPSEWLAWSMLALFILERVLAHARRG